MLPARQRLRDESSTGQVLEVPLRRTLRLPSPEDPARVLLIRIQLSLNVVLQVDLINLLHAINRTLVLVIAVAVITSSARERLVIASALAKTIKPFRTVGLRACPFADDGPFVCSGELGASATCGLDVCAGFMATSASEKIW
jgi:hypothetical protein